MDSPVHFALGFHCHQPVGNFDWVFEQNYRLAYLPLLTTLDSHPTVPFSLHLTGPLLEWLDATHPAYLDRVGELAGTERLELKGGPFYECILPLVPGEDRAEQLEKMQAYAERRLGVRPQGSWIPERVWEPQIVRDLAEAGLTYAAIDDAHFHRADIEERAAHSYFVTEDQGFRLNVFPISRRLRYLVPFEEPSQTRDLLRQVFEDHRRRYETATETREAAPPLLVCEDDGEKFGAWPQTFAHVHQGGWLERFLTMLEDSANEGWLVLTTPGRYQATYAPNRLVYVAQGSYTEMEEWSGGNFRNFLTRYPEANRLHKRAMALSRRAREHVADVRRRQASDADVARARTARDHVLRAQCNDTYWHGVFGGLYLPHLRQAAYTNLIRAEALLPPAPPAQLIDVDLDGAPDVRLRSPLLMALVAPARGGSVWALDHLPTGAALLDSLRRRREPEHAHLEQASGVAPAATAAGATTIHGQYRLKEPGLERLVVTDPLPRDSLIDHFLATGFRWEDLRDLRTMECGDFATASYSLVPLQCDSARARLFRMGRVANYRVSLAKEIALEPDIGALRAWYCISVLNRMSGMEGLGPSLDEVRFAPELTINLLGGHAPEYYVLIDGVRPRAGALGEGGTHLGATSMTLVDTIRALNVRVCWDAGVSRFEGDPQMRSATPLSTALGATRPLPGLPVTPVLHRHGVHTVSLSEDGFEKVFQGTAVWPTWPLSLRPGQELTVRITIQIQETGSGHATSHHLPV